MFSRPGPSATVAALAASFLAACVNNGMDLENRFPEQPRQDIHSYANPNELRVEHVALDLDVDFERKVLEGSATLTLVREDPRASFLILDSRDLAVLRVEAGDAGDLEDTQWELGDRDGVLGAPLRVTLPAGATQVRVHYATEPTASGLQWLEPPQTAGKRHPFLYSQSQAIHARSWIPLQDSPGVRVTYTASVRAPAPLVAAMSAEALTPPEGAPEYKFRMTQPIAPYLIALAVGELRFQSMSSRTGVWAEPSVVAKAAAEFEDTEAMMQAVEALYGPYRWERYDILVLPPSFPFGGMENPRLTFATPTVLAGDKSLVALVAHELAHSWSGNLVSNATWRDFWLNEGFTVYLESRIQELVFSPERAAMEGALEVAALEKEMEQLPPNDEILYIDLTGRDPDEAVTSVPYIKGMLLLRTLERAVGREEFDAFLRGYFERHAFQSISTIDFLRYLDENLLRDHPGVAAEVGLDAWIHEPGLPENAAKPVSQALANAERQAMHWAAEQLSAEDLPVQTWTTQEWLHFLRSLPDPLTHAQLARLDDAFGLNAAGNSEILHQWLLMSVKADYPPARGALEEFLITVGRRKFVKPLYEELAKTEEGMERARTIYSKARSGYHPISSSTIDKILSWRR